jgi:hypothetical protein
MNTLPVLPIGPANAAQQIVSSEEQKHRAKVKETFNDFVGQTFYGQLLASMRKTVHKSEYFHGGRAEEVFQGQLDQTLAERMSDSTADSFSGPMFELFSMQRQ